MSEIAIIGGDRPKLEPRHLEELTPEEQAASEIVANREARARYGPDARAKISPATHEHARGEGATVGILRVVRQVRKGLQAADSAVFVVLGRGPSWTKAFADADAFKRKIEERLGNKGIEKANGTYARRLSKLHR